MRFLTYIILFTLVTGPSIANAQNKGAKKVQNVYKEYNLNDSSKIGTHILVFKSDTVHYQKSFGFQDIENNIPFTENSLVGLGSLSKLYTSVAIFKLIEKGKIDLETKLGEIFSDIPAYCSEITIKNLLDHKSGLPLYNSSQKTKPKEHLKHNDIFAYLMQNNELVFTPGEKSSYNQIDYALLATVIEKAGKKSYEKFLKKYVFKPAKLKNTFVHPYNNEPLQAQSKRYYTNQGIVKEFTENNNLSPMGFARIYSSPKDFAKFLQALHNGKLISKEKLKETYIKAYFSNTTGPNLPRFSFSGINQEIYSIAYKTLGGNDDGYSVIMLRIPADNINIVMFTNNIALFDMQRMIKSVSNAFSKVFLYVRPKNNIVSPR